MDVEEERKNKLGAPGYTSDSNSSLGDAICRSLDATQTFIDLVHEGFMAPCKTVSLRDATIDSRKTAQTILSWRRYCNLDEVLITRAHSILYIKISRLIFSILSWILATTSLLPTSWRFRGKLYILSEDSAWQEAGIGHASLGPELEERGMGHLPKSIAPDALAKQQWRNDRILYIYYVLYLILIFTVEFILIFIFMCIGAFLHTHIYIL